MIDGALDRMAALRQGDAVVVATGAAAAPTIRRMTEVTVEIVRRLKTAAYNPALPFVRVDGALTSERVNDLVRAGEKRQVVVADATRIIARGQALDALDVRCERPVRPIACTVFIPQFAADFRFVRSARIRRAGNRLARLRRLRGRSRVRFPWTARAAAELDLAWLFEELCAGRRDRSPHRCGGTARLRSG